MLVGGLRTIGDCRLKAFCLNRENLPQQVQTQISQERKTLSGFFIAFLKCTLNLEYFENKDHSHSLSVTEIINSETSYLKV